MNQLQERLRQPAWSKEILVWVGQREALDATLVGVPQATLDLLDLLPEDDALPSARDARADILQEQLDQRLQEARPTGTERLVLRVRNAALLARYGVGLRSFYDWFGGNRTMTVLEIDRLRPITLPDTVAPSLRLDPDWLLNYFRPLLHRADNLCIEA